MLDRILLIADSSPQSRSAAQIAAGHAQDVTTYGWDYASPKPPYPDDWRGDWILAFKAHHILTPAQIAAASAGALNFHLSPPRYRGIGGAAYAIHSGDPGFGVVCHRLVERVDSGPILAVRLFPIGPGETTTTLRARAIEEALVLFKEIVSGLAAGRPLPSCDETWSPRLHTRAALRRFRKRLKKTAPNHPCLR